MNAPLDPELAKKSLMTLPPERQADVSAIVDFLSVADDVAKSAEPALTPEEIEEAIRGVRAARHLPPALSPAIHHPRGAGAPGLFDVMGQIDPRPTPFCSRFGFLDLCWLPENAQNHLSLTQLH